MKTRQLILALFLAYMLPIAAQADGQTLQTDADGYYLLSSADDWKAFAAIAEETPNVNARMTADIDLGDDQTMIGSVVSYQGVFNGQGHTLTVAYSNAEGSIAPFRYVEGATIEDLHVTGRIESYYVNVGGIAAIVRGDVTTVIRNCWSSSHLISGTGGIGNTIGGIASDNMGILVIEDCLFDGSFAEKNRYFNAGFVPNNWNSLTIRNSLNIGSYYSGGGTFYRTDVSTSYSSVTLDNVYYKNANGGVAQGTAVTDEQLADGTVVALLQNGRTKEIWTQGATPVLSFSDYADQQSPVLLNSVPQNGEVGVPITGSIMLTFDKYVRVSQSVAFNGKDLVPSVNGKTVVFEYFGLAYNQNYTFVIPANSVMDLDGNYVTEEIRLTFTTSEYPANAILPFGQFSKKPWLAKNMQNPVDEWYKYDYDDSNWDMIVGPICRSSLPYVETEFTYGGTYWLRRHFTMNNVDASQQYVLYVSHDDGCVVWLNGTEVLRENFYNSSSLQETWYSTVVIDGNLFKEGDNVMAVYVHDVGGNAFIDFGIYTDADVFIEEKGELVLELSPKRIEEGTNEQVRAKLSRTGDWSHDEIIALKASTDSRVNLPNSVTIPARQSAVVFNIPINDNDVCDLDSVVEITAIGDGYAPVTARLLIEDNEYPDLRVTSSKSLVTEGETFQLTITASRIPQEPLMVTLTSEDTRHFTYPRQVTLPVGQTSVTVNVTAKDDDVPSSGLSNTFVVSAPRYNQDEVIVVVEDNDMPVLELTLTPNKVTESAGPVSLAGVLRRTGFTDNKITVKLSDDSDGVLYFSTRELVLNKGVEEVCFNFGPIDNAQVDGNRTYTVTAAVWLSSCSCSAAGESGGAVSAQLEVFDDDGPALTLASTMSTIKEGGKTMLTVGRNTLVSLDQSLTVHLSSDYDDNLSYEHTVTIPAGQQTIEVEITSKKNDVSGDTHTAVFTVQSEGFASATCYLMVTDQSLPDAVITDMSVAESEVEAGGMTTISVTVKNGGQAILPSQTHINIYVDGETDALRTLYTQEELNPGESTTISRQVRITTVPGDRRLHAIVNEEKQIAELSYNNNTSLPVDVRVLSPYRITIQSDKTRYLPGETVLLSGSVTGSLSANAEIEVYVINDGLRQILTVTTDNEGKFKASFIPYERQMGHFTFGACYPSEGLSTEQGSFDYVGLRKTSQQYITCEVTVGTPFTGTIEIENPCSMSQHNIRAEVLSAPENCEIRIAPLNEIPVSGRTELQHTIIATAASSGTEWKSIKLHIASDEGASTELTLYCYCRLPQAQLALDVEELNTTMTKGVTRDYPITISNKGAGATGRITLTLPTIIQAGTATELPSLSPGETTTAVLRLVATDDMQLNVPVTGQIGINCENGNGVALPFSLLPVSETKGTLEIDVCDEYTYYTEEAPHLAGARVQLRQPYGNQVVLDGLTDNDGKMTVELPEGYYTISVTADKHDPYENNIIVDPGKKTRKVVNLSYQGITVNWNVEETEVEDEYEITTTLHYETNVPVPVVVTKLPEYIPVDSMAPGESRLYYATLTNKGLITAEGVQIIFPDIDFLTFEPLMAFPINLLPQQAVVVPFRVTLSRNVESEEDNQVASSRAEYPKKANKWKIVCVADPKTIWFHWCGNDHQYHDYQTPIRLSFWKKCHVESLERDSTIVEGGIPDGNGGFIWIHGGSSTGGKTVVEDKGCRTCLEILLEKAKDELIGHIPVIGCFLSTALCSKESIERAKKDEVGIPDIKTMSCEMTAIECAVGQLSGLDELKAILDILSTIIDFKECFWISFESDPKKVRKAPSDADVPSFVKEMEKYNQMLTNQLAAIIEYNQELFGDEDWIESNSSELLVFLKALVENDNKPLLVSDMSAFKPSNITIEQLNKFVCRMNNTFFSEDNEVGGHIDFEKIEEIVDRILAEEEHAQQLGYLSVIDLWTKEFRKYYERLSEGSSSVCASVTLEIKQVMTLTRPAYRGTLTVFNGHDSAAMTDARLNLVVKDEYGNIATAHEFQINAESLDGFEGELNLTSGWTLEAQKTGTSTVLFIPTKYAAPTEPVKYSFGGTLSYVDPFTGLEVTRDLFPVTLTVNPSPDLELTYLMQRDVYGDDPLTEEVVEPMEPAEFALIINNKGNGEAKNMRMVTEQPKITDNEKGLLIDFNIVSSQVNGAPAALSLGKTIANDFGTINAHSQAYAQWWLESTLLGHFTSYEVAANHVTSYGNQDLSLIDTVTIHEMVHGFTVDAQRRGYLVNDILDADDLPDVVYLTDATQLPLHITTEANISSTTSTTYRLIVTPSQAGWNYGSLTDPTNGKQRIIGIKRQSDGAVIPTDNAWQTDRTLRDGRDWLYENRIHFVVEMNSGEESYMLYFEDRPDVELAVEQFIGVPTADTVFEEPLDEVTVRFNKPIKAESFTTDDLTLYCQGVKQNARAIVITQKNNTDYALGLSKVNRQDGYFVLTVQTAGITDDEGFNGVDGKTASWIQFLTADYGHNFDLVITSAGYATFYDSQWNYQLPSELKAYVITGEDDHKLVYRALADDVVPQGVAVLIESNPLQEGIFTLTSTETAKVYNGQNLLRGTDEATIVPLYDNEYAYKLAYGSAGTEWNHVLGWFWGTEDGGAFYIDGHKAWLVVPKKEGTQTRAFLINGEAISDYDNMPKPESRIYDLQGRRVVRPVVKGIYIKDGHKITIK